MEWVYEGLLARSSRPGYPATEVSLRDVEKWLQQIQQQGIQAIICLLSQNELDEYYRGLPAGLLAFYEERGLAVDRIYVKDYQSPAVDAGQLTAVHAAFQQLPRPVLIHCSAGMVRTGRAVEYLRKILKEVNSPIWQNGAGDLGHEEGE